MTLHILYRTDNHLSTSSRKVVAVVNSRVTAITLAAKDADLNGEPLSASQKRALLNDRQLRQQYLGYIIVDAVLNTLID